MGESQQFMKLQCKFLGGSLKRDYYVGLQGYGQQFFMKSLEIWICFMEDKTITEAQLLALSAKIVTFLAATNDLFS